MITLLLNPFLCTCTFMFFLHPVCIMFSLSNPFTLSNIVGKKQRQGSWINRLHLKQSLCGSQFCQQKNRALSSLSHKDIFICVTVNGNVVSLFSLRERVLSMMLICAHQTLFPESIIVFLVFVYSASYVCFLFCFLLLIEL